VRQIAVEAPAVSTVLGHSPAICSSIGARKIVRRQVCLSRTRIQLFHDQSFAGSQAQQAVHQVTRAEVSTARPPLVVALPRYSWHE